MDDDPYGWNPWRLLGWTALVLALMIQGYGLYAPDMPGPEAAGDWDKVSHVAAFAVPTALAALLRARWIVVLMLIHALVSEPLQGWLWQTRSASGADLVADLVGIALGWGVAHLALRRADSVTMNA